MWATLLTPGETMDNLLNPSEAQPPPLYSRQRTAVRIKRGNSQHRVNT